MQSLYSVDFNSSTDLTMIRFPFSIFPLLFLALSATHQVGCQWSRQIKPMTPSQYFSGELSRDGNAAMEKGNWEDAEKKLGEAVKLNKKDIELRRHYADALWNRGKQAESLRQLDEAIKRGGAEDGLLHISLAEKRLAMEDPATAFRHADEAVRLSASDYRSWALRAKAGWLLARGEAPVDPNDDASAKRYGRRMLQSRNDYYRALSLSPNNRDILPELAAVQMLCGQAEHALATWQNLQELFPPDTIPADLLRGKAEAYIALGRFDDALSALSEARVREPNRPEIDRRLREVLALTQQRYR